MSHRCCPEKPDTGAARCCPRSGSPGKAVPRQTIEALLTAPALVRLPAGEYRFCPDAHCPVVYFGADSVFTTEDVRVTVWQKRPFGDRQICYCFDESEASLRAEIEANGHSSAAERIREHIAASRCACEVRNPRGSCCLGDVMAAIERVTMDLSPRPSSQIDEGDDPHDGS